MSDPTPIRTHYLGYAFRSRLEARWAVFLETLQLQWRYEPEGFSLPSGPYLPDFLLELWDDAGHGYWVEIKPTEPSDRETRLVRELARSTGKDAYIVAGEPWPDRFQWWMAAGGSGDLVELCDEMQGAGGMPAAWLLCERDRDMGFSVDPYDAYRRARAARFEHGERPGLPLGWEGIEPVVGEAPTDDSAMDYFWSEGPTEGAA